MTRTDLGGNALVYMTAWNAECAFWPAHHIVVPVLVVALCWAAARAFWRATEPVVLA